MLASVSRHVAAVGETFSLEVELLAEVISEASHSELQNAFSAGGLANTPAFLEVVRSEPVSFELLDSGRDANVARLSRRLVMRSLREGSIEVPPYVVVLDGQIVSAAADPIYIYKPTPELHESRRAIVPIFVERTDPVSRQKVKRTGTAFFVSDEALVTSYHVVVDARKVFVTLPSGRRLKTDRVWSVDPVRDVAVLYVEPGVAEDEGIVPLSLQSIGTGSVEAVDLGRAVFTYGWPGGLRRSTAGVRFDGARLGYDRAWVTSNAVGPGDSGGPLLNSHGEVVGVVTLGTMVDSRPDVLEETVCIANDPRPALGLVNSALGPRSLRSMFADGNFRSRPYVQAFRLLAMIGRGERFGTSLRAELDAFENSLATRNSDPGLHFFRGILYRMLGTPHAADSSFANVLDLFEEYFPAAYLLGVERFREGRLEQAAHYFQRTILAEPYRNLAKYGLARTLMRLHRYEEASQLFREVVSHDPDYAPAIFHLALCHIARGDKGGMAIASARLGRVSRVWRLELDRVLRNEVLHPKTLQQMPLARFRVAKTP